MPQTETRILRNGRNLHHGTRPGLDLTHFLVTLIVLGGATAANAQSEPLHFLWHVPLADPAPMRWVDGLQARRLFEANAPDSPAGPAPSPEETRRAIYYQEKPIGNIPPTYEEQPLGRAEVGDPPAAPIPLFAGSLGPDGFPDTGDEPLVYLRDGPLASRANPFRARFSAMTQQTSVAAMPATVSDPQPDTANPAPIAWGERF
ncbi:hypothetical protein MK489_19850, partial [Myxococcota bacterium]|nr:hypothetical protein [Myxococcota bacterium]